MEQTNNNINLNNDDPVEKSRIEYSKQYYLKNKDRKKKYYDAYYTKNRDYIRKYQNSRLPKIPQEFNRIIKETIIDFN